MSDLPAVPAPLYLAARAFAFVALRVTMAYCGGLKVRGARNVPKSGAVLFVCNHLSVSDPPLVGLAAPRPTWFLAREYLFRLPLLGPIMTALHAFPVDPAHGQIRAIKHAARVLDAGEPLVIFPEGRCSLDGRLHKFQAGAGLIAWMTGAAVVPVGLERTNRLIPVGKFFPRRLGQPLSIRFGPPVDLPKREGARRRTWVRHATTQMQAAVAALLDAGERK